MARYELGDVIATRKLSLRDGTAVVVSIGCPRPFPREEDFPDDDSFFCPYRITGLSKLRESHVGGVDAVQALRLALQKIGVDLKFSEEGKRGDLFWLDDSDDNFGFPAMPISAPPRSET
jgi:hypothetical protein